jgi:hypothetical protein
MYINDAGELAKCVVMTFLLLQSKYKMAVNINGGH